MYQSQLTSCVFYKCQDMELFDSVQSGILYLISVGLVILIPILVFFWGFSCLHISKCVEEIPHIKQFPVYHYWLAAKQIFKERPGMNFLTGIHQLLCGLCYMYDKQRITKIWIGIRPLIFLYKPETVEVVLSSNSTIDKSLEYRFLHPWLGTGLITSTGEKWRSRRKLLTSSFHFRILDDFIPVINDQSEVLVQKMKHLTHKDRFDIVPLIAACALEIICETTMGVALNAQHDGNTDYVRAIHEMGDVFLNRCAKPWLWIDWMYYQFPSGRRYRKILDILHGFARKVIREKKDLMIQQMKCKANVETDEKIEKDEFVATKKRKAFLELLLEHHLNRNELTEEDIREEVDTFMFAGHDTITMAVSWALYNIGLRSNIQDKVFMEIDSIFNDDLSRPVTTEDLKAMKYLDCVIKESLRLYPSVPFIARELKHDIHILSYTLPPGAMCFIFPYMLHRDSETFPNPEYFDPDRFTPENSAGRHPYAYIPFSAGPRNCIGQRFAMMEEKIILTQILRQFEVKSLDHRENVYLSPSMILRSVNPLHLKLLPRKR